MNIEDRTSRVGLSRTFKIIRDLYGLSDKAVLDVGCGFGEYLRLFGPGSVGITTTKNEVDYGKEQNLPIVFSNAERIENLNISQQFEAIWANNLYEHLLSPHAFLIKLKKLSQSETLLILGVPVVPKIVSTMKLRWFRGSLASNHISFFTSTTLKLSVERAGWVVMEVRPFIFKNKVLDLMVRPFAPHLYVVARNNSLFQYPPKKLKEWVTDEYYKDLLVVTNQK